MKVISLLFVLLLPSLAYSNSVDDLTMRIEEVEASHEPLEVVPLRFFSQKNKKDGIDQAGKVIAVADKLVALGTKVWKIVEKGKPVVNLSDSPAISVLPKSEDPLASFYIMENWSMPKVKTYKVVYENLMGIDVISFTFSLQFQYGGTFEGKGSYITGATVYPRSVDVAWGFEFGASTKLVNITNRGTKESPLAAANIQMSYSISSPFKKLNKTISFYIDGKGNIKKQ